ncbi:unnamed protein product [Adineta ricciae]|uniref:ubiquitinyl hydrolase 1 n=1 Tax=Adineta ricciae TaxID=249248 RepID=A0A813S9Y6_ADIRI|nr:unnamed protein product [Adineta ricciae]CAF0956759.1 unnamed protein product [Adineta ricciae]
MAVASPNLSESREYILNQFQEITALNIEDAICFLDQYDWKLDDVINDYYNGIEVKQKPTHNPNLGRFYSIEKDNEQHDEDSDRHYAELLQTYGDADDWARAQQSRQYFEAKPIYHEKQRLMRCGLHSLNNLFQMPKLFTNHNLESIVREFDKRKLFNDYRTLWLGNYDLRILIEAINRCGFDVRQIDVYRGESFERLPWDSYFGLLINLNGAHWFTIKNLSGIYYNLDSTLRKPIEIGQRSHLIQYLYRLIRQTRTVYLFVVSQKIV